MSGGTIAGAGSASGWASATPGVREDDLVTGDAVALQVPTAGVGLRILSGLVDVVCWTTLLVALVLSVDGVTGVLDDALGAALGLVATVFCLVLAPMTVEILTGGRSPGRYATGTCVVRTDGGPVAARQCLTRALVGFVEIWMTTGLLAVLVCLVSRRGQRLGDLAAGTCCVRVRVPLRLPPPVTPVPALEPWVRSADIGPLPEGLGLAVRQLLLRREGLHPQARAELASELGAAVLARVSPPPPVGAHVEDVLRTVLAERARRDALRLERDRALRERLHLG